MTAAPPPLPAVLADLLNQLDGCRLVVAKFPSSRGGYVRAVCSTNATWYQRLCGNYVRPRRGYPRPRTIIRRQTTRAALVRMLKGNLAGVMADRIIAVCVELGVHDGQA